MTSSATRNRRRRAITGATLSGTLAVGLTLGFGLATAQAEPADSTTQTDAAAQPQPQTVDELLAVIDKEYDTGSGGGQLSNLIHAVLQLRAQGIKPSEANRQAILNSLKYKPNQTPLINALKDTLSYQQKVLAQMTPQSSGGWTVGINQYDPSNPGALGGFGVTGPNGGGIGIGGGG